MECPFCKILTEQTEQVLKQSEHTFTVLSNPRLMPGHTLVIPKRHVEKMSELSSDERRELFDEALRVEEKILARLAPGCDMTQHYRPFIPQNDLKVDHLHIHVRPRHLNDDLYTKVQAREREVFAELSKEECEKYRKLLFED